MKLYRFILEPHGSFLTNWASDTIFGALCWMLVYRYGEAELATFLEACTKGEPPFVISDAFPGSLLPKPFIPLHRTTQAVQNLEEIQAAKKRKKTAWLSLTEFKQACRGEAYDIEPIDNPFFTITTVHNQISRLTGTTGEGGQLYPLTETYLRPPEEGISATLALYAYCTPNWIGKLHQLLSDLGQTGLGAKASIGKGSFHVVDCTPFDAFGQIQDANGFVTLGHMVPAAHDPVHGFYKTTVKRGRLGEGRSSLKNPFKKPLVLLQPGSAFYDANPNRYFAGRMVTNIAPAAPDAVHCGLVLTIPAKLP